RLLLRQGTHAIHLVQFAVITAEQTFFVPLERSEEKDFDETARLLESRGGFEPVVVDGGADALGIVTVHDGSPLEDGEIIAPSGEGHDAYQKPQALLAAGGRRREAHDAHQTPGASRAGGGRRGRQLDVLVEGTYYLNRLFATVELVPK